MKKVLCFLLFYSLFISTTCLAEVMPFLTEDEIPTVNFLPLPPESFEAEFSSDLQKYEWGKTVRNTPRGEQAKEDAAITLEYFSKIFSKPFDMVISKENTPEISALLERLLWTTYSCIGKSKSNMMRIRPFVQFNEPTPLPEEEERLKENSSYPSGHTMAGWAAALVLAEINPLNQNEILSRGFEYGQSRVIVGFHYQSDVDHARLIASVLVNRLHANADFLEQMQKAKAEFKAKQN